jgi:hypothetical protein
VYLATLQQNHELITRQAAGRRAAEAEAATESELTTHPRAEITGSLRSSKPGDLESGGAEEETVDKDALLAIGGDYDHDTSIGFAANASSRVHQEISRFVGSFSEFVLKACTPSERSPSFILVDIQSNGKTDGGTLELCLQHILDGKRGKDIEKAQQQQRERRRSTSDAAAPESAEVSQTSPLPDLAATGPLQLRFHSFRGINGHALTNGGGDVSEPGSSSTSVVQRALFEVNSLTSTPHNSPGVSRMVGWPLRSLCPAATACAVLCGSGDMDGVKILGVEAHSRQSGDYYAATAVLDIVAFAYAAFFYNQVVHASGSISGELVISLFP